MGNMAPADSHTAAAMDLRMDFPVPNLSTKPRI
jgi:hypothetical protein